VFPAGKAPAGDIRIVRWNQPDPRPWLTDPIEHLEWLSTSGAEVWAPTRHELRNQKIRERAHPNGEPQAQPQIERQFLNEVNEPRSRKPNFGRVVPDVKSIVTGVPIE
jgi:hypothetical protein